ncbi:MAG: LD-carboxypeptidase, partial [Bacteroidota bacterium]
RLCKGDTVSVISPASFVVDELLEKAVKNIESLGLKVKLGKNIRADRGYIAGTDAERLADLHAAFSDPQTQGVWCARGGYGCTRLLPNIDYKLICKNPKVFVGFSDITALHQAFYVETGLVSFHGPVGASDFTDYSVEHLTKVLFEPQEQLEITLATANQEKGEKNTAYQARSINAGVAEGKLAGGNLSLVAAMAGTKWAFDAKDHLFFLEEIGEKPYRVDRMLTQTRQTAHLKEAAGLALGVFANCAPKATDRSLSLQECLDDRLKDLNVPTVYGLSFGHISHQFTLPVGVRARLDTEKMRLTLLEPAVV